MSDERIDRYLVEISELVDRVGLAIQGVFGDEEEPHSFAYTVGLAAHGHPELIVFGLPMKTAQSILNDAVFRIIRGELALEAGDTLHRLVRNYPVRLLGVHDSWEHLTVANRLYGNPDGCLPALQIVFPDSDYRWPWESGSRTAGTPLLGPVTVGRELTLEEE